MVKSNQIMKGWHHLAIFFIISFKIKNSISNSFANYKFFIIICWRIIDKECYLMFPYTLPKTGTILFDLNSGETWKFRIFFSILMGKRDTVYRFRITFSIFRIIQPVFKEGKNGKENMHNTSGWTFGYRMYCK